MPENSHQFHTWVGPLGWDREFCKERKKKTRRDQDLGWVDRWERPRNKSRSVIQGDINKDMPLLLLFLLLLLFWLVVLWPINSESFLFCNELIFRDFIIYYLVSNTVSGLDCSRQEKRRCSQAKDHTRNFTSLILQPSHQTHQNDGTLQTLPSAQEVLSSLDLWGFVTSSWKFLGQAGFNPPQSCLSLQQPKNVNSKNVWSCERNGEWEHFSIFRKDLDLAAFLAI